MTQIQVDNEELRRFSADLGAAGTSVHDTLAHILARYSELSETWNDVEHARFDEQFQETILALRRAVDELQEHADRLVRKAEPVDDYLARP